MNMIIFWIIIGGIALALEVATAALCSIWFVAGAVISIAAAALGAAIWVQALLFILVSVLCFILLYPKVKRLVARDRQATNADKVIGQVCVVTQRIDNLAETGAVAVDGKTWTARASAGEVIEAQALVRVERIEGVKLIVTPAMEAVAVH